MIPIQAVVQLFNKGLLPEQIIGELRLDETDRDEVEAIIDDPTNYMTEDKYWNRIQRGIASPAESRVVT